MSDLVKINNDIISHESENIEVIYGKVLRINLSITDIDFKRKS